MGVPRAPPCSPGHFRGVSLQPAGGRPRSPRPSPEEARAQERRRDAARTCHCRSHHGSTRPPRGGAAAVGSPRAHHTCAGARRGCAHHNARPPRSPRCARIREARTSAARGTSRGGSRQGTTSVCSRRQRGRVTVAAHSGRRSSAHGNGNRQSPWLAKIRALRRCDPSARGSTGREACQAGGCRVGRTPSAAD